MQVLDREQEGRVGRQAVEEPAQHAEQRRPGLNASPCAAGSLGAAVAPHSGTSRASSSRAGPTSVSKAAGSSSRASRRSAEAIGA